MRPSEIDSLALKIWDFCNFRTPLVRSDAIFVLCSHDIRIAKFAADLYFEGWAPYLVFSGGLSPFTSKIYDSTEAETFGQVARKLGVPASALILETQSRNTQENLEMTMRLMRSRDVSLRSAILVQKPNMLRRVYATATKLFPDIHFSVTSHDIGYAQASHEHISKETFVHELTGDLQRLKVYAERGFIVPQEMDPDAWGAFERLVEAGYRGNLVK